MRVTVFAKLGEDFALAGSVGVGVFGQGVFDLVYKSLSLQQPTSLTKSIAADCYQIGSCDTVLF